MHVKCILNGDLWGVSELLLTEGYNEGWTFSASIPGLTDRVFSTVALEVGDTSGTLALTMALESSTEDSYGMELRGRDKASRDLSHAYYDGSSLHCENAAAALSSLCSFSMVGVSGTPQNLNIHYASTDVQTTLDLLVAILDICASRYNSNGTVLTFAPVNLGRSAAHVLSDVIDATFSVDYEAKKDNIRLSKSTPCDINQSVTVTQNCTQVDSSGRVVSVATLGCSAPDNTEWVKMCQSAVFDSDTPGYLVLNDGTQVNLSAKTMTVDGQTVTLSRRIADYALCIASSKQIFSATFHDNRNHAYRDAQGVDYHFYHIVPYGQDGFYRLATAIELPGLIAQYTDENDVPPTVTDYGIVTEKSILSGMLKLYCCSSLPSSVYPIPDTLGSNYDATSEPIWKNPSYTPMHNSAVENPSGDYGPNATLEASDLNALCWDGMPELNTRYLNFVHSGRPFTTESCQPRFYKVTSSYAVRYLYINSTTLIARGSRYYSSNSDMGPTLPSTSLYPYWHVRRSVDIQFKSGCSGTFYKGETAPTLDNFGKYTITFGEVELNSDFDPNASVPHDNSDALYASPCYAYNYSFGDGSSSTSYSQSSNLALNCAARVVSYAINRKRTNTSRCAMQANVSELDISDFMPIGGEDDVTHVRVVGVSQDACPTNYTPSFSVGYPNQNATDGYVKASTMWQKKSDATNNAEFYLWWENKDWRTASFTLPLRLDIRAGDLVSYQSDKYLVMTVTHKLSTSDVSTALECSRVS